MSQMNQQSCLSDLLEKGMAIKKRDRLTHSQRVLFYFSGLRLTGCCALGAMVLGAGIDVDARQDNSTDRAIAKIRKQCPQIDSKITLESGSSMTVSTAIVQMNDGQNEDWPVPQAMHVILAWLKERGL